MSENAFSHSEKHENDTLINSRTSGSGIEIDNRKLIQSYCL
jgi:hypothetical protein